MNCRQHLNSIVVFVCVFGASVPTASAVTQQLATKREETKEKIYEDSSLRTSDGVNLRYRFYGGGKGKQTVPVMIVHEFGGQGSTYYPLAQKLQDEKNGGCAVLIPDLRGHGNSTDKSDGGEYTKLDYDKLRRGDFLAIVTKDLVAMKRFLVQRNNEAKLNIDMMCVVAVDTGGVYALNWIQRDWSRKQLVGYRRGKDPKAFVLISPKQRHLRTTMRDALRHPIVRSELSVLMVYGAKDSESVSAARRIGNSLKPHHPSKFASNEERKRRQDLFITDVDTSLSGGELVNQASLKIPEKIAAFIDLRLIARQDDFPWAIREDPFAQN